MTIPKPSIPQGASASETLVADWLAGEFAEAERQWRELPVWARPVYVPPLTPEPAKEGQ